MGDCGRGRRAAHREGRGGAHRDQGQPRPLGAARGGARRAPDTAQGAVPGSPSRRCSRRPRMRSRTGSRRRSRRPKARPSGPWTTSSARSRRSPSGRPDQPGGLGARPSLRSRASCWRPVTLVDPAAASARRARSAPRREFGSFRLADAESAITRSSDTNSWIPRRWISIPPTSAQRWIWAMSMPARSAAVRMGEQGVAGERHVGPPRREGWSVGPDLTRSRPRCIWPGCAARQARNADGPGSEGARPVLSSSSRERFGLSRGFVR